MGRITSFRRNNKQRRKLKKFRGLSLKSSSLSETFWDCPEISENNKPNIVGVDVHIDPECIEETSTDLNKYINITHTMN